MPVLEASSQTEIFNIIRSNPNRIVLIFYGMSGCGHCKHYQPNFENLSNQFPHDVFVHLECGGKRPPEGVRGYPTTDIYQNGVKIGQVVGNNIDEVRKYFY